MYYLKARAKKHLFLQNSQKHPFEHRKNPEGCQYTLHFWILFFINKASLLPKAMKKSLLIACHIVLLITSAASGAWNWYRGDLISYTSYPPDQITRLYQDATDQQLDYRLFYDHHTEGNFTGLSAFLREETFHDHRIFTPILGTTVSSDSTQIICFGIDPRSPIPMAAHFKDVYQWVTMQGGVAVTTQLPNHTTETLFPPDFPILFQAQDHLGWRSECQIGGQWDSLLTLGYQIGIVGASSPKSKTTVWAESSQPEHLFIGFNNLATTVSEAQGLQAHFRVNGELPGAVIIPEAETHISISASSETIIEQVRLIADGEIIWSDRPQTHLFNTRQQIPLEGKHYVRAEFLTNGQITRTSPVFFETEFYTEPLHMPLDQVPFHLALDNVIETLTYLPTEAQARVLSEYLGHPTTRFPMAFALENRTDFISEAVMVAISESPFPQVRLGGAFVHVMQNQPNLSSFLSLLLSDPDPAIQKYAARMLLQYTTFQDATQIKNFLTRVPHAAQSYLIQTLDPSSLDQDIYRHLIHVSGSTPTDVASSATAKLVEMGNRNFRVIRALRDSAHRGHIRSLEILGTIGDDRIVNDIEKIYTNATPSPLKNTAFRVLQTFYKDMDFYPNRPEIQDKGSWPLIDGITMGKEWQDAAHINHLVDDAHTGLSFKDIDVWVTRDNTDLLFALKLPPSIAMPDTTLQVEFAIATQLAPQIPFLFTLPLNLPTDAPQDPNLKFRQTQTDSAWTIEGQIPFLDLGLDPNSSIPYLRFNTFVVIETQRWSWTPTYGQPENPYRFGTLKLHTPRQ